jgi:choline transport protein
LTSSIPSAGGVYHWASITPGPRYGRIIGFFTGSINYFGWIFDLASIVSIPSNVVVQMYAIFHPDLVIQPWHVYIAYVIITWSCCFLVIFGNRLLPALNNIGLFLILAGGLVTIIVCAAMPKQHADSSFVWASFDENNVTGWSGGIAFLTGVLNGAFTVGTPDAVTKMAEELPDPKSDMPKAIFAQIGLGTLSMSFSKALAVEITNFCCFSCIRLCHSHIIRHNGFGYCCW